LEKKKTYGKQVSVGFQREEWALVEKKIANSTCRSISAYIKKVVLGEPVTVFYRSKSFDEALPEVILLRKELHAVCAHAPFDKANQEKVIAIMEAIMERIDKMAENVLENRKK